MTRTNAFLAAGAFAVAVVGTTPAEALTTFDLTGNGGFLGPNATFSSDGYTVDAQAYSLIPNGSGLSYSQYATSLTQTVFGLGVASLGDVLFPDAFLQVALIDNVGLEEVVRFEFSDGLVPVAAGLTLGFALSADDYAFWENDTGLFPELTPGSFGSELLDLNGSLVATGSLDGPDVVMLNASKRYLFVAGNRFVDGPNDGFAVSGLVADLPSNVLATPVPAALPMLLAATAALGAAGYRRRTRTT